MNATHNLTMQSKSSDELLYLNLYNFDNLAARDCPYILTSPRSLEACRKAGFKPVELLHRSIQDYQEILGEVTLEEAQRLYAFEEKHRLSKLEKCRAIRKQLIQEEHVGMNEGASPCSETSKNQRGLDISWKEQSDKENDTIVDKHCSRGQPLKPQYTRNILVPEESQKNGNLSPSDNSKQWYKILSLTDGGGGESSCTSSYSRKKKLSSLPNKSSPTGWRQFSSPRTVPYRKSSLNQTAFPVTSSLQTASLPSAGSSTSTLTATTSKSSKGSTLLHHDEPGCNNSTKPSKILNKSYSSSRNIPKRQTKSSTLSWPDSSTKESSQDYSIATNYDSNNNCRKERKSPLCNKLNPKRKQVSFRYLTSDDLCLPEHDRRILESMALKKELEWKSNEFAHHAHILWEKDREKREQLNQEQATQWQEYVAERRRLENAENAHKWEEMRYNLCKSQMLLQKSIQEKEERSEKLRKATEAKKLNAAGERNQVAAKRRAEIEAAQQQMELEATLWQQNVDQQQKEKLEKAENIRLQHRENYRRRVASANRVEELHHEERRRQVKEETEAALQTLRRLCQMREKRAQERYQQLLQDRDRQIKGQSLERAIKFQQVRELHDELDQGLQKWQQQVLTLQWESTERAQYNAIRQVESKRQRVETENKARQQHHTQLMEKISREEEARLRCIRDLISHKEAKMKHMAQERDLAIRESRLQAQTTADLREHLRRTLSPETFDRKVARVAFEMRVAGRPPTASPTMTRSHIFLG